MNSAPSGGYPVAPYTQSNSFDDTRGYPQLNNFNDARSYLDSVLEFSRSGVEHVNKFFFNTLQEKTNHIEALRAELAASQNAAGSRIYNMQQTIAQLKRQLDEKDTLRDLTLNKKIAEFNQLQQHAAQTNAFYTQKLRALSTENEQLKFKLSQAEQLHQREQLQLQQLQKQPVADLDFNLTEEQKEKLQKYIGEELIRKLTEAKGLIIKGLQERMKESQEQVKQLQKRVRELEEQLEGARTTNDHSSTSDNPANPPAPPALTSQDHDQSNTLTDELSLISQRHNFEGGS